MSSSTPELDRAPYLVSTDWLAKHLNDPNLIVVDCRYYFDGRDGAAEYAKRHLPAALHLDWSKKLIDPAAPQPGTFKLPSREWLKDVLEPLGISDESLIVGYDDEGGHFVSRLLATMAAYGYDNVRVLEGGIVKWRAEGRTLTTEVPTPARGRLSFNRESKEVFASIDDVISSQSNPGVVVLDVRRLTEFTGEEARARHGGRVPWARWALWQENLNWDGDRTFKDPAQLRQRFGALGVTPDKRVITYCQGGVRAAHTALTLRMLGYPDVRIFDGSWEEWGNRDDVPIATGPDETSEAKG
jgi:thiosulfate/3-mercaptopyruvate sulfurtransferase